MSTNDRLRSWYHDYHIAKKFCEKYGLCYQNVLKHHEPYSLLFVDADSHEICCCVSRNTERSFGLGVVHYEDIIHCILLHERDLDTDLEKELFDFCSKNGIIASG